MCFLINISNKIIGTIGTFFKLPLPFNTIEIGGSIMAAYCIQQVIKNTDSNSTSPFTHGSYHSPLIGLWVIPFNTGNGVSTAPTTN